MENDAISSLIFIETIESINQERKKKIPSHFPRRPLEEDEFRDRKRNTTRYWTRECKSMARNLTNSKKLRKRKRKKQEVDWKRKENRIEIALYVRRPRARRMKYRWIDWLKGDARVLRENVGRKGKKKRKKKTFNWNRTLFQRGNNVGRLDYYQANGHLFLPDTGIISPRLRPRRRKKTKKTQNSP